LSSLKQKSLRGITWSFIDNIAGSGVTFLTGIILARILSPQVFGLIGMVTVFFAFANTLIDSGFSIGLIRKVQCSPEEYDTVFYFNVGISSVLYFLLFFTAHIISAFFKEPQLVSLIRILSTVIIIDSLSIVQRVIFIRNINFKTQTLISLISSVSAGVIGIGMAYKGYGVWSLVFQQLVKQTLTGILFWAFSSWRPAIRFSIDAFKELFRFGSRILGSGMIVTIQNNIYYLIIGKFFSASSLGFYTRAEQFNSIVTNNISGTFERVFFPVLASIQEEGERLKATLKKILKTSFFITFFALLAMAIMARPMILLLIGPKWEQSVLYLQLLCIGSVFFPFNVVNSNILKVKGRSDLILRLQIIKTILTVIIILSGIFWGIICMLVVRILTTLIATFLNSKYSGRLMDYSIRQQLIDIVPYFISESVILLVMFSLNFIPAENIVILCLQLVTGTVLFFLIFERRKHPEYIEIKEMFMSAILHETPGERNE
jgi:teichuronic acid exporter